MPRKQIKIPKSVVQKYLNSKEGDKVAILEYKELGSGWHGTGYRVKFQITNPKSQTNSKSQTKTKSQKRIKEVVIRTLMPADFSHDYMSDRAKVFILQHEMSKGIPRHIESFDVSGYTGKGELISLGGIEEYFQIVEVAHGSSYSEDFQRIKATGKLNDSDIKRAKQLSDHLVLLHSKKLKGSPEETRSIRRRHSRDAVGHGEMLMGVIDTYPDELSFTTKEELTNIICKAASFREKVKDVPFIPCRMHGDFHPGNIMFNGKELMLLDASREVYGDPADDVTTLAINYIWFAVMQSGSFSGPFADMFNAYWDNYFNRTNDAFIAKTAGLYFAFRGVVTSHPVFYKEQSDGTRKKMIRFIDNVLSDPYFDPKKINEYLR